MNKKMQVAIEVAAYSTAATHKMGCAVYDRKGNLLATGINKPTKSHPIQAKYAQLAKEPKKIYLHAELDALIKCKGIPYSIYVARITRSDKLGISMPCAICQRAIQEAGIKYIFYINDNQTISQEYV